MSDIDERFNNFIKYRRITKRSFNNDDGLNFATDTFIKSNGSKHNYKKETAEVKFDHARPNKNELSFPPRVEESIEKHLTQLNFLSVDECEVLNDNGEPLVQAIRDAQGDLEPGWSATRVAHPAELLLPTEHRLFVTTEGPEIFSENQKDQEFEYPEEQPSYKNNLGCSYGGYYFVASSNKLLVYVTTDHFQPVEEFPYLTQELLENQFDLFHMTNEAYLTVEDDESIDDFTTANYICTKRLFGRDVLVICDANALVLFFDLEVMIKTLCSPHESEFPLVLALKVPRSCWSVDVITTGNVAFVAAGHNLPGVSLFAISKSELVAKDKDDIKMISKEIISEHNVPTLTFIRPDNGLPNFISLVMGSIFGSVTTIKIETDVSQGNINAKVVDIQFLADEVWTVTSLKKSDFLAVPQFELLNLNFQEASKNAIQKSIIMDSKILNLQPRSIYHSGEYGIGTLTTQIPVPVSNLGWLCVNGIHSDKVKLKFTTFDREGLISEGVLKKLPDDSDLSFVPLSQRPYNSLERLSRVSECDELKFTFKHEEYQIASKKEHSGVQDIWKKANFEIRSTSDVPNLTKYNGFTVFSEDVDSDFENNDITEQHNKEYYPKGPTSDSILANGFETVIHVSSTYFHEDHEPQSWKDITVPDLNVSDRSETNESDLLNMSDVGSQKSWWVHNHASKVKKLLGCAIPGNEPCGFKLTDHDNDILFITTHSGIMLAKPYPLIITSYSLDEIFPLDNVSVCINIQHLMILNRINFVCHIKELNCIAVASQAGLISLLRLTEFRGIYSFRQEYIIGWNSQVPFDETDPICIRESVFSEPHRGLCRSDDFVLPLPFIKGMDYRYCPENKSAGTIEHVELTVSFLRNRQTFRIFAGDNIGNK